MIKELKYFFYIITIIFFILFNIRYYFSETNIKSSNRKIISIEKRNIDSYNNLLILKSDTKNIIEIVEKDNLKNNKKYKFLELLSTDEK